MMKIRGFPVLLLVTIVSGQKITVYDNFGDGLMKFGPAEEIVTNFLAIDLGNGTGSLPKSFTICCSVWIKFTTTNIVFFQIYKNEKPWIHFRLMDIFSEHNGDFFYGGQKLVIDDVASITTEKQLLVSPFTWTHGCLSVDTISGELLMIINGITIFNDIHEPLVNTFGDINGQIDLFKVRVYKLL